MFAYNTGDSEKMRSLKKRQKDKADRLFSLKIREIGYCELAGKDTIHCGGGLQCAHIETRGAHGIRWNELNAVCLCAGHHVYYTNNPNAWDKIVVQEFPVKWAFVEENRYLKWDKNIEKVLEELENRS